MNDVQPSVSILIPALNEERYIERCLRSVLVQTFPQSRLEVLVIDGGSTDRTRACVAALSTGATTIRVLDNPHGNAAAGLNVGLQAAGGEYLLRVDAHCWIEPEYVARCLEVLQQRPEIGNAGGQLEPLGDTPVGQAIALALRSPFSMGGSPSRYTRRPRLVDTVYLGAFRRHELRELGGYDARLGANEDYELNYRLRRTGRQIWCDPAIRAHTITRRSLGQLIVQYARYGFWKARVIGLHPRSVQLRHLIAPAFLLILATGLFALGRGFGQPLAVLAAGYGLANLAASWLAARHTGRKGWLVPLVFALMHLSWAAGFLAGLGATPFRPLRRG